ncbi:CCA tRNA nucleotidyltransferase [Prochlorococcus marinus]|uniref:tRNA nucleotidyltransferase n=1 Tax=Prochlorococcus marinus XMU1408 TaxID=2213228 RepID=A0A318R2X0_PROMR|nr:CCA tRNA nucleotidyltransferase [Prochlorococcus marinus]MBW3041202.1 tRNA nucleotidyltransferase [Prochlorococcus marinus str. XMU1408]PYE03795.1 tRNA nucleotidyltransferase [Prochlorococcus marinus XMU1408]
MIIKDTLLSIDLFGDLNLKDWPISLADLPPGSALVGGSVRDGLLNKLGRKPDLDFVIPTSAIKFSENLSKKINATLIRLDEKRDIARLVVNGWTLDFASQAGGNLKDDLFRRDFRINAIALRLKEKPEIFDPTGGIDDLKTHRIVAISEKNLIDDPLRILRGFRLMCELNFVLDRKTKKFLKNNVDKLSNVAPERIKMEILKIVNSEWNPSVWTTYLELKLLKNWYEDQVPPIELKSKFFVSQELKNGSPLAKLICLLSDEGLSSLTFSKNQIKRCKNLRFWVNKINNFGLDKLSEDERFQLHIDLEEDLPSLMLFLEDKYINPWLKRWKDLSDPLFHPSSPLNGSLLQEALKIPPGPFLGELMRHLAKGKAYGRFFTKEEALEVARKWTLENSPFL